MAKRGMGTGPITQHETEAMTGSVPGSGGNFGAGSLHDSERRYEHMDAHDGTDGRTIKEGERSAPPPIRHTRGKHPATAHSDHGPHMQGRGQKPMR
jgi:hypothetical protein